MAIVGRVIGIWRYPVKSMGGEQLESAEVDATGGIAGDRGWATRDDEVGEIRGAKKLPALLECTARYLGEPTGATVPPAEIGLPGGEVVRSDAPDVADRLSALVGRRVSLWPKLPPEARDHYRRVFVEGVDPMEDLREIFGRLPDEPLPDFSIFPPEILELTSPAGTYFDAFPLHVLTTGALRALSRDEPSATFDVRRFRPNVLVETQGTPEGQPEFEWVGRSIRVGRVPVSVSVGCPRCVMTTLAQPGLTKEPSVLRTIVRRHGQNVGVYGAATGVGRIAVGDEVELA